MIFHTMRYLGLTGVNSFQICLIISINDIVAFRITQSCLTCIYASICLSKTTDFRPIVGFIRLPKEFTIRSPRGILALSKEITCSPRGSLALLKEIICSPKGILALSKEIKLICSPKGILSLLKEIISSPKGIIFLALLKEIIGSKALSKRISYSPK